MKIGSIAILLLMTPVMLTPAVAQSLAEKTGVNAMLDRPPDGAGLLLEIHQFNLFEQGSGDLAQTRGDASLKEFATKVSNAADKRDDELQTVAQKAGMDVKFPEQLALAENDRLAGLQGSVGASFVRSYYADQVAAIDSAVSELRRYLQKPDNAGVKAFAEKQLPILEANQATAKEAWKRAKE